MPSDIPPPIRVPGEHEGVRTVVYVPQSKERSIIGTVFRYLGVVIILLSFVLNLVLIEILAVKAGFEQKLSEQYFSGPREAKKKVAIVSVTGVIGGGSFLHGGSLDYVRRQLKQAREDENVVGVVIEVNSGGGSVSASDEILNEVEKLKKTGKPVIVWMGGMAASGGYYISCKADTIYASHSTITGSIGVISIFPNVEELEKKVGVHPIVIKSAPHKDIGSPFRQMTPEEAKQLQGIVDSAFVRFKKLVAEGRGLPAEEVDKLADGSIYTAEQALKYKLVDKIGYLDDAIKEAADGKEVRVVRYAPQVGLLGLLAGRTPGTGEINVHLDTPLSDIPYGLHYLWLPGESFEK